jgi:hypothetical protein
MSKINKHVSFSRPETTVPASTEVTLSERSPVKGTVNFITLHFPDGCNALVEIRCYIGGRQILPVSGFIALNNTIKDFPVFEKVDLNQGLRVTIANRDSVNAHTPSVIWNVESAA